MTAKTVYLHQLISHLHATLFWHFFATRSCTSSTNQVVSQEENTATKLDKSVQQIRFTLDPWKYLYVLEHTQEKQQV